MNKLFAALSVATMVLGLGACHRMTGAEMQRVADLAAGKPVLVTVAPDGTKLWKIQEPYQRPVYFSTSGTQTTQTCGKGCSRSEYAPAIGDGVVARMN